MAIDWASLVPYRVLYRLPGPFGWNDKTLNAEKENMAKRNDENLAKMIRDLRAKLGVLVQPDIEFRGAGICELRMD